MPRYLIFWTLLVVTCGYALWRGRKYEQLAALVCIIASVTSVLARAPVHARYASVELGDLLIDTFVLLSFVVIALRSDRFWPLWVAGLQLTLSMSHVFKVIEPDLLPRAYAGGAVLELPDLVDHCRRRVAAAPQGCGSPRQPARAGARLEAGSG